MVPARAWKRLLERGGPGGKSPLGKGSAGGLGYSPGGRTEGESTLARLLTHTASEGRAPGWGVGVCCNSPEARLEQPVTCVSSSSLRADFQARERHFLQSMLAFISSFCPRGGCKYLERWFSHTRVFGLLFIFLLCDNYRFTGS